MCVISTLIHYLGKDSRKTTCHHLHVEIKQIAIYQHIFCLAVEWDNISVTINDTTHCLAHFKCPDTDQSIIHLIHGHIGLHTDIEPYTVEQP